MLRLTYVFADHALFQHSAPLRIRGEADLPVQAEIRRGDKVLAAGQAIPNANRYFEIDMITPSASFEPCTMLFTTEKDFVLLSDIHYYGKKEKKYLDKVLAEPNVQVRIFGKPEVKGHRRMGVILARGENVEDALAKAEKAYETLEVEALPR